MGLTYIYVSYIYAAYLFIWMTSLAQCKGTFKKFLNRDNWSYELSFTDNIPEGEQNLWWVRDSYNYKETFADCNIESLDCLIAQEDKTWFRAWVEKLNNRKLRFTLLLINVTRPMFENVRGSWRLITHKANPKQRVYFSQEIQVNEPVDPTCSLNWAIDGLNIICTYPRLIHSLKMSVGFGQSSSKYLFLNNTCHGNLCHLLVPKKDLPFGSNTLVVYVFTRPRNSSTTLSYEIEHYFVLENPQVNKIACSTPNNTPGRIVCTCARTDSSDVTSEFTWRVNNLIQHSQPGLDISQGSNNSVFTLDLSLSVGLQEISCQVSNVLGWKSGVEVYTLDQKVLLATTIRELEPMSVNDNDTSEHLTARERKAASKWRRNVLFVPLGAVVVLFFVCMVGLSYNKAAKNKFIKYGSKLFCRMPVNISNME